MKTSKNGALAPLNEEQRRQRKFYLVIPLLILPFLTMAFWALGGGRSNSQTEHVTNRTGLDATLPQAQFKAEQAQNKMAVYQENKSPSDAAAGISPEFLNSLGNTDGDSTGHNKAETNRPAVTTAAEQSEKIEAKLAQINKHLQEPAISQTPDASEEEEKSAKRIRKLRQMVETASSSAPDPEMRQLSQMLKQIQAIQNPASVKPVGTPSETAKPFRAITAVIDGKQRVADGAAVKLKLTDTVTIKGQSLRQGQQLFGVCQVTNQRLLLKIQNIRLENQIIPVSLTVFSQDGMPGIPAPEAELGGVTASNADQTLQSMQLLSMDQSIASQAAAGGINAAKDLFSKKVKKVKVKLSDGYPVLLKINK